jgi:hypothetical protein
MNDHNNNRGMNKAAVMTMAAHVATKDNAHNDANMNMNKPSSSKVMTKPELDSMITKERSTSTTNSSRTSTRSHAIMHDDTMATPKDWLEHAAHLMEEHYYELPRGVAAEADADWEEDEEQEEEETSAAPSNTKPSHQHHSTREDIKERLATLLQQCDARINNFEQVPVRGADPTVMIDDAAAIYCAHGKYCDGDGGVDPAEEEEHAYGEFVKRFLNQNQNTAADGMPASLADHAEVSNVKRRRQDDQAVVCVTANVWHFDSTPVIMGGHLKQSNQLLLSRGDSQNPVNTEPVIARVDESEEVLAPSPGIKNVGHEQMDMGDLPFSLWMHQYQQDLCLPLTDTDLRTAPLKSEEELEVVPGPNDVICGWEEEAVPCALSPVHIGNERFLSLIRQVDTMNDHQEASNSHSDQITASATTSGAALGNTNPSSEKRGTRNSKWSGRSFRSRVRSEWSNQSAVSKSRKREFACNDSQTALVRPKSAEERRREQDERRRSEVANSLVQMWQDQSPPGRFLEMSSKSASSEGCCWAVVEDPATCVQSWLPMTTSMTFPV